MAQSTPARPEGPWFIAENMALDFINTLAMSEKGQYDFLQSDDDVRDWLQQAGVQAAPDKPGALLAQARALREAIRQLIEARKNGHPLTLDTLNDFLATAQSHLQLSADESGTVQVQRLFPHNPLGVIAEQAAELLAHGQFAYIRQCEHPECTLWFYDKTKAHRRRWCSMALCGNRAKVARFRQNKQAEQR
ncbi:CGNR zinc finger domain-containing protein [Vagococcus sp. WN89Y]|uniref:CGNR zinc finger domain-containing protein n=1 Tax=Vagococcus sp. WN89Y TaxID=3457258 RepID=UPI003FCEBE90